MTEPNTYALRARWVFPVDRPPVRDGVVTVAGGRIVAVGEPVGVPVKDLGNVALLPGLINAHTHLEFSLLEQPLGRAGMPFPDWIGDVVAHRRSLADKLGASTSKEDWLAYRRRAVELGMAESSQAGVAACGEIATVPWFPDAYPGRDSLPIAVPFLELLGLSPERLEPLFQLATSHISDASSQQPRGLSPHAPYTTHPDLLRRVCKLSKAKQAPLAMHLAESPEELELLRSHSGSLVERLRSLDAWFPISLPRGLRPLDYLETLAAAHRTLVIHGNFLVREEMDFLAARRDLMSVVYCPRTQAYFPHGPYPLREMLDAGVHVAVGTDSRATNPDLSVLAELRHIAEHHPSVPPEEVLKMGTMHGARALGLADELGSLTPGKRAAFAMVPLPDDLGDPYELLLGDSNRASALPLTSTL